MPHRLVAGMGLFADWSVFGAAVLLYAGQLFGMSYTEAGALATGGGALIVGIGRFLKYLADAEHVRAQTRLVETYTNPDVYHKLEGLKCYNAPDCPTREIFKREASES